MRVIYERCAGLDIHKRTITACRIYTNPNGQVTQEVQTFGTTTAELLRLLDWLLEWECTHVAMESTSTYWQPVYNILEGNVEVLLVNARHIKAVPGRKTDVQDAEWVADLLRHGLMRASFVPPRPQRELRALTRQRLNLVRERATIINRLQSVLEDANIKLSSVVSDVVGLSARDMLAAIVSGQDDPAALAELARGRMRSKREALEQALAGHVHEHHRFLLANHLTHIDFLEEQIAIFDQRIMDHMAQMPSTALPPTHSSPDAVTSTADTKHVLTYDQAIALLDTIPGINRRSAEVILAETGIDMSRFPSAHHLASWTGLAPGNNESAGKRKSGRTPPGNKILRQALVQAAHGAARQKGTYLHALYGRLAARRGAKRAIVAVAHSILVAIYHMLSRREPYRDLGDNYFDERKRTSVVNRLVRRLEKLGCQVDLKMQPAV